MTLAHILQIALFVLLGVALGFGIGYVKSEKDDDDELG